MCAGQVVRRPDDEHAVVERQLDEVHDQLAVMKHEGTSSFAPWSRCLNVGHGRDLPAPSDGTGMISNGRLRARPQESAPWRVVLVTLHRILGVADALANIALDLVGNAADLLSAVPGQATQRFLDPSPDLRHRALGVLLVHLEASA